MRIAIFYNLAFGGAKRVVYEHAKGLYEKGHQIDLYTTNLEKDAFDPSKFCTSVHTYNFDITSSIPIIGRIIRDFKNFYSLRVLHKNIANKIDSGNYDVVLVHPDKYTQAPYILRYLKTKNYYYCQEPLRIVYEYSMRLKIKVNIVKKIYEEVTRYYRKKIDRENVRCAAYTIASCYYVRERMIESYEVFPKVIYCAVDEKIFKPEKVHKKNQIFYVGSPSVIEDGYDLVVDALKCIPKNKRPKLHIVSWRKENGERLSEKELTAMYNQSIVTICSSRLETFGLVPLESMACGVPVIATKVSGHRETICNDKTGYLVDFDPKEISQKILFLIENPKIATKIGKSARVWIKEQWTWKSKIDDLEKIFISN